MSDTVQKEITETPVAVDETNGENADPAKKGKKPKPNNKKASK